MGLLAITLNFIDLKREKLAYFDYIITCCLVSLVKIQYAHENRENYLLILYKL